MTWLLTPVTMIAFATACVGPDGLDDSTEAIDENVALTRTTEVAHVETSDGTSWRFIEGEPGDLFVWSTQKIRDGVRPVVDRSLDGLRAVDLYRRLTSAAPPRALVDAQARADVPAADPPDDGSDNDASSGDNAITSLISASDFADAHCFAGWDYLFCWPSTHGNPYVQHRGYHMRGAMAAVSVTTRFRYRSKRYSSSSWGNYIDVQALPGEVHTVTADTVSKRYTRRFEILDNGTHAVRYANYGQD